MSFCNRIYLSIVAEASINVIVVSTDESEQRHELASEAVHSPSNWLALALV